MTLLCREWSCYWNSFLNIFDNRSFLRSRKILSYSIIKCKTKPGHAFFPLIPFFWHRPAWPTKKLSFHTLMPSFYISGCRKFSSAIWEKITVFSNQHNSQSVFTNIILFDVSGTSSIWQITLFVVSKGFLIRHCLFPLSVWIYPFLSFKNNPHARLSAKQIGRSTVELLWLSLWWTHRLEKKTCT